jgi:ArsR family metal-binding transcriptional regulator
LRLSTVSADVNEEIRRALIEKTVSSIPRGMCISDDTLNDIFQYAKQTACPKDEKQTNMPLPVKDTEENFKLQMEETEGYI